MVPGAEGNGEMKCRFCGHETNIVQTVPGKGFTVRWRHCQRCGKREKTIEMPAIPELMRTYAQFIKLPLPRQKKHPSEEKYPHRPKF